MNDAQVYTALRDMENSASGLVDEVLKVASIDDVMNIVCLNPVTKSNMILDIALDDIGVFHNGRSFYIDQNTKSKYHIPHMLLSQISVNGELLGEFHGHENIKALEEIIELADNHSTVLDLLEWFFDSAGALGEKRLGVTVH